MKKYLGLWLYLPIAAIWVVWLIFFRTNVGMPILLTGIWAFMRLVWWILASKKMDISYRRKEEGVRVAHWAYDMMREAEPAPSFAEASSDVGETLAIHRAIPMKYLGFAILSAVIAVVSGIVAISNLGTYRIAGSYITVLLAPAAFALFIYSMMRLLYTRVEVCEYAVVTYAMKNVASNVIYYDKVESMRCDGDIVFTMKNTTEERISAASYPDLDVILPYLEERGLNITK